VEKKTYFDYFGGEATGSPDGQGEVGNSAPQAEAPAQDLRVSQRIPIGMSVKVQTPDGAEEFATTRNVSNRGVCFVSNTPYKVDDEVRVELYVGPNRHVGPLPGRIAWAFRTAEAWEHGVTWTKQVNMGLATAAQASNPTPHGGSSAA
jgi:hypothetical protein